MNRTQLQKHFGLSEVKLDNLLNEVGSLPQFKHLGVNGFSTDIPSEVVEYIKETVKPNNKALQASKQNTGAPSESQKQNTGAPSEIDSMSIANAEYNEMDVAATNAIENMDEVGDRYRSNSQAFTEGMDTEALVQEEVVGTVAGRLRAVARIKAEADEYERIMLDHAEAQRNHTTNYTQQLFNKGQSLTTESTDERIKKQAQNSQAFDSYATQLLGKLKS